MKKRALIAIIVAVVVVAAIGYYFFVMSVPNLAPMGPLIGVAMAVSDRVCVCECNAAACGGSGPPCRNQNIPATCTGANCCGGSSGPNGQSCADDYNGNGNTNGASEPDESGHLRNCEGPMWVPP